MAQSQERSVFEGEVAKLVLFVDAESVILVSKDHVFQPHVRAAVQRIMSQFPDRKIREERVGIDIIAKRFSEGAGGVVTAAPSQTDMQRDAMELFREAVRQRASDIHIQVDKDRCIVRFRVNNDLVVARQEPGAWGAALGSTIYHSMADVADATFEPNTPQDGRIGNRRALPDGVDGIRIATTPVVDGFLMVLRLLYDASGASTDLTELGYSGQQTLMVQVIKRRPTGMNIVSGPTGSGKSTTLQRILIKLIEETKGRKHVITVEDPPEYPIPGASQTPVTNADSEELRSAAFQRAIKAAMRVDPDVVMIGEMRDTPSARLAVQASLTGHQVWATLHANGAFYVPDRLIDMHVQRELIFDPTVLSGLMGQRLLKTLCPGCKVPLRSVFSKYRESVAGFESDCARIASVSQLDLDQIYVTGDGCPACRMTGTAGRSVVAEVVATDYTMLQLMREGKTREAIDYWRREHDGMTMREHAILKVRTGAVDPFAAEAIVGPLDSDVGAVSKAAGLDFKPFSDSEPSAFVPPRGLGPDLSSGLQAGGTKQ